VAVPPSGEICIRSAHASWSASEYTRVPLLSAAIAPSIGPMTTTSHAPDAALTTAERSLKALEGTLSKMVADSAVAAERLHAAGAGTSPEPHIQAASWWLHRLAGSALATRATCRAARAAIRPPGAAAAAPTGAAGTAIGTWPSTAERTHGSERSIVIGYDGSDAKRALGELPRPPASTTPS
jgi:hypothetical protein